jgi:hypothetical protein
MLPYDQLVIFRGNEVTLRYAMTHCKLGETIGNIDILYFNEMIKVIMRERGQDLWYAVDDKYGKWRFILRSPHTEDPPIHHKLISSMSTELKLPDRVKPISLSNE